MFIAFEQFKTIFMILGQCSNVVIHGISGAVLTSSSAAPGFVYHGPGAGSFKHVSCWHWVVRSKVHVRWLGDLGVISLGPTGPKSLRIYQPYEWPEKPLHWDHGFSMVFLCFCLVPIIGCGHSPLRLWRRCSWRCGWRCCRWCCRWRWQLVVIVQCSWHSGGHVVVHHHHHVVH